MKTFRIPVVWKETGVVEIEAESLEQAKEIFEETKDDLSLLEGYYIDSSFGLDEEVLEFLISIGEVIKE